MPPTREDRKVPERGSFRGYKLKVGGLVDNPVELSLMEIQSFGGMRAHRHASLHPGLVRNCAMERSLDEDIDRSRQATSVGTDSRFFSSSGTQVRGQHSDL